MMDKYKIITKLKNSSVKVKLIAAFLVFTILPILSLELFSYYYSTYKIKNKINNLMEYSLTQSAQNINSTFSSYEDLCIQIVSDDELIKLIDMYDTGDDTTNAVALNSILGKLTVAGYSRKGIVNVSIRTSKNKKIANYNRINGSNMTETWTDYDKLNINNVNNYEINWNGSNYIDPSTGLKYNFFNLYLNITDQTKGTVIGVLAISINEDEISKKLVYNSSDAALNVSAISSLIVDKDGTILSAAAKKYIGQNIYALSRSTNPNMLEGNLKDAVITAEIFGKQPLIINKTTLKNGTWNIINAVDEKGLFYEIYLAQRLTMIVIFIVIMLCIFLIFAVSNSFTKSIRKIVHAMKVAQNGDLSVKVDVETKDEISIIGVSFNKMMLRISDLLEQVKKQMEITSEALRLQKEAEIRALEAQINPHFLYNTLDCINWMAIDKEEYEISKMLKNLAEILRYSVYKSNKIVSFSDEIQWLKEYIYLQETRFNNSFKTVIDVDDSVMHFKIHKLLIQPFIENSIIHGFEDIRDGGVLSVSAHLEKDNIVILIKDNGKGIEKNVMEALTDDTTICNKVNGKESIGISNVINRLKMYYGDDYKLEIESGEEVGTTICLKMPEVTIGG